MYRVSAEVRDDRERRNQSELTLWVAGGKQPPKRDISQRERGPDSGQERVSGRRYGSDPGAVAVLPGGRRDDGCAQRDDQDRTLQDGGPSTTLSIPIQVLPAEHRVEVNLAGSAERPDDKGVVDPKLPRRPAFAKGEINLPIPPLERKLAVQATPKDKAMEPGKETTVAVDVKDASGRPVGTARRRWSSSTNQYWR